MTMMRTNQARCEKLYHPENTPGPSGDDDDDDSVVINWSSMSKDSVRQTLQILFWKWFKYYDNGIHSQNYNNKNTKTTGDKCQNDNLFTLSLILPKYSRKPCLPWGPCPSPLYPAKCKTFGKINNLNLFHKVAYGLIFGQLSLYLMSGIGL